MVSTKNKVPPGATGERAVRLFIAAQIGVPVLAHVHRWITGVDSWWGWQMFSR